jgi:hypothetical protein
MVSRAFKIIVGVILTALLGYFLVVRSPQIRENVSLRDSVAYWSAGRLLVHQQDPYDHANVLQLEREQGYKDQRPLVLRTPPWSLFIVAPLGWLSPFWAWVAWIAISIGCLFAGIRICFRLYGSGTPLNLLTILGYTFAPVPACLVSGQMGLVLMLGIVLFLWAEKKHPFLAGAVLILPFAKPHLLAVFWLMLLVWVLLRQEKRLALGFLSALVVATAFAVAFDVQVFQHYRNMLNEAAIGNEFIPALSGVLRLLFFRRMFWVQFVPLAAGLIWAVRFFQRNRSIWDWREHGPALLIVSVLVTPYEWLSDETVLLPAILQAAVFAYSAWKNLRLLSRIGLAAFALMDVLLLLILKSKVPFSTGIYFWSSVVWFFWYFRARSWALQSTSSGTIRGTNSQTAL